MVDGKKIKELREKAKMSQEELGRLCGTTKQTIFKYETGIVTNIPLNRLEMIARVFDVDPGYFTGWESMDFPVLLPAPGFKSRPRLGEIACGQPIFAEQNIQGYDAVPEYVDCDFTLKCKGDSMTGARIYDGDIVCIKAQQTAENGQICAVLVDDEATLKRVRFIPGGVMLMPENPKYEPIILTGENAENVRIIGRATHFIGEVQ